MSKTSVHLRALHLTLALCAVAFSTSANRLSAAPVTAPMGSYGILMNQWPSSNQGNDKTSALLGVLTFDGAGNVKASYTKVNRDYTVKTGTATGTYSANPDGSNTINLKLDDGSAWTMGAAVTDGGAGLQLVVTGGDPMNAFPGSSNPAEVWTGTGRTGAANASVPPGAYAYLVTGWPDAGNKPFSLSGIINFDGAGNLTGTYTLANGRPTTFPGTFTGTYTLNPDGSGAMTLQLDAGLTATLAITVIDGGSGILLAGSLGNQVNTGTARLQ